MDILQLSAVEIAKKIRKREFLIEELLDRVYEKIEEYREYNCFISLCRDEAYSKARIIQKRIDDGEFISPLAGVPIAIKDNIVTKNIKTTCCSKMLENFRPTYDATVIEKINDSGLIIVGKLNMDEFAMGSTTETSIFGATKNPYDKNKSAGGSSGGSAAAAALKLVPLALGSDTGGSIREPASFCNVIGLKPTYGRVSRSGLIAFSSSLDCIGVLANCAEDCAELLNIISGEDRRDSTSLASEKIKLENVKSFNFKKKKIAVVKELLNEDIDEEVKNAVEKKISEIKKLGADAEEISMPLLMYAAAAYYIICCAEASSNLSRYDGIRYGHCVENPDSLEDLYIKNRSEGFCLETKRRIMLGNFVLSADCFESYYKKALKIKNLIAQSFYNVLKDYDFILSPVYPTTAPVLGQSLSNPLKMYMGDICTVGANLSSLPAISIPCGFDKNNMPIGLQLMSGKLQEEELLGACKKLLEGGAEHEI